MNIRRNILQVIRFVLILTFFVSYILFNPPDKNFRENNILTVAANKFSGIFNPLYARAAADISLCGILNELLLDYDREGMIVLNGKTGEVRQYNGIDYTYYGISDCTVKQNGKYFDYNFELRDDVYFGDGVNLTADDVIFTMYVMADPSYTGVEQFYTLPVLGMEEYRLGVSSEDTDNGKSLNISGIIKTGKYSFTVTMSGDAVLNLYKMSFSVLPLHYYGDKDLFDIESNRFGFERGNLAKIKSLNSKPLGAGPYIFKDYSDGVVHLLRNEKYYKGAPETENVSMCEITSGDEINGVLSGLVDIATIGYGAADVSKITEANSNGKLSGNKILSIETQVQSYGYIGINALRVKVGNDASSYESKSLRKAFATLFSVYRDIAVSSFFYSKAGCLADVTEYPIPSCSWASPQVTDSDYKRAFSYDKENNFIYKDIENDEDKYRAALDTATEFFIEAGYEYDASLGIFTSAPQGASLRYTVVIPGGGKKAHPSYTIASMSSDALKQIGITLEVIDLANTGTLWSNLLESEYDMWSAARSRGADPDLYQIYHSDSVPGAGGTEYNYNFLTDKRLDDLIVQAAFSDDNAYRKQLYGECFEIISDWAVEIPVFTAKTVSVFNAERIDTESVLKDATSFRNWSDEIEKIKLK